MIEKSAENIQFWGCIEKETGVLVAYAMNTLQMDMCTYNTMKAIPAYLTRYYPFYGLIYKMNEYYLEKKELNYVCDGSRSITEHSNIQEFLVNKFGFRKAYCHLKIVYRRWMQWGVNMLYPFRKIIPVQSLKYLLTLEQFHREDKRIRINR